MVAVKWTHEYARPWAIRSYNLEPSSDEPMTYPLGPDHDWTLVQAARATSAAPTYFEWLVIVVNGVANRFIDGGMVRKHSRRTVR